MRTRVWNVNSAQTRLDRMAGMLRRSDIDVLAIQEAKCKDDQLPIAIFEELGHQVVHHGLNQWNGVVIISRVGFEDIQTRLPGQSGPSKDPDATPSSEACHIAVTCGGMCVHSLYTPNDRDIADPHFEYKLELLERLHQHITAMLDDDPEAIFVMGGGFNTAPTDGDIWSMAAPTGKTHITPPERAAFYALEQVGMKEVTRQFTPNQWIYWDYKAGRFSKDEGMRIGFQLASPVLATKASAGFIDIEERRGKGASDHAPVIVDYEV